MRIRTAARTALATTGFAVAIVLATAAPAGAVATTATPDHVAQGGSVTIEGTGFDASSPVDLIVDGFPFGSPTTADGTGTASVTFAASGTGIHTGSLVGSGGGHTRAVSAVFSVTPADSAPTNNNGVPGGVGQSLPRTGIAIVLAIVAGLVLIGVGFGAVRRGAPTVGALLAIGALMATTLALVPRVAHAAVAAGEIKGTVTGSGDGAGVGGICVHASSGSKFGKAPTAADGTYSITGLAAGKYAVAFADCNADPTYLSTYYGGGYGSQAADAGVGAENVNVSMIRGASVAGRITDATSSGGVKDACVRLGQTADATECIASTGTGGYFFSTPTTAGTFVALFDPADATHAFRYYKDKSEPTGLTTIAMPAGTAVVDINQTLPQAGLIQGVVRDATTNAAPARCVRVSDLSGDVATMASGFAETDGTFTLAELPPGAHKVKFEDCEGSGTAYITQFYNAKANVGAADPVTVTGGQTQSGVNANMSSSGIPQSTSSTAPSGGGSSSSSSSSSTTSPTVAGSPGAPGVSNASPAQGEAITLTGDGFRPGSSVDAFVFSAPVNLGSATADAAGRVSLKVTIPKSLTPGQHTIQLQGIDPAGSNRVLARTITVVGTTQLRVTGGRTADLTVVGVTLLAAGALLIVVARRRRGPGPFGLPY